MTASSEAVPEPVGGRIALVLRHDPGIGLGNLEPVLVEHGYAVQVVDTPSTDLSTIDPLAPALIVALGGDEGAYEGGLYPYIDAEIDLLRARIAAEAPIFGVCLGAQMLAASLGGSAFKGPATEVGYLEVVPTDAGESSPVRHFRGVPVVQWHGDTYELPEGVTTLAGSDMYANQAFGIDDWLLAVQFHPEVTAEMHEDWVQRWGDDLPGYGLSVEGIRADREKYSDAMQDASRALLGEYLDGLER